ncbi:MAG TPA: KH domain-containing protein [archaeon]|nr:KH domain-containing protein [archaeon]
MISSILVPNDRIGVVNAKVRERLETEGKVKVKIDGNAVILDGEGFELFQVKNIVHAIGRGFSPQKAFRLLDSEQQLDILDLGELSERRREVVKGRVIGRAGRTRELIEEFTGVSLSVYGNTISLIGTFEQVKNAKEAVQMIIQGSMHSTVYRFLEHLKL